MYNISMSIEQSKAIQASFAVAKDNCEALLAGCFSVSIAGNDLDTVAIAAIMSREVYNDSLANFSDRSIEFDPETISVLNSNNVNIMSHDHLKMESSGMHNGRPWTYKDGVFQSKNGSASVTTIEKGDYKSVMVAFRGTDQLEDVLDYVSFDDYYDLFKPLMDAVKHHANQTNSTEYLVGHSLGGAAAQTGMMRDSSMNLRGIAFGSPGSKKYAEDSRVINILHPKDIVPIAGSVIHHKAGAVIKLEMDRNIGKKWHADDNDYYQKNKHKSHFTIKSVLTGIVNIGTLGSLKRIALKCKSHRMNNYTDTIINAIKMNNTKKNPFAMHRYDKEALSLKVEQMIAKSTTKSMQL